ncbi:MAG TPA: glycoside hydrolase family 25 protein [Blastocatellia bacterium]|nr:glycoside hydrolase family 25 protein [Blastocatellia bacterium]
MLRKLSALILVFPILAFASEFKAPWEDPQVPLIIDAYFKNNIDWEELETETRVSAMIHKSTVGTSRIDPMYVSRRAEARRRGYLWGSYHWGEAGNPEAQAEFYIKTVDPGDDELIALDLEDVNSKALMNADEALIFIKKVKALTGRYPILYTNHLTAKMLSAKYRGTEFAKIPLWYARFKSDVTDFPTGLWPTYTLWQFSSEIRYQKAIAGTERDIDVNVYNGTTDQLRSEWPLTRREEPDVAGRIERDAKGR